MPKNKGCVIPFPGKDQKPDLKNIDLDDMSEEELSVLKDELTKLYDELQEIEFDDPESPECFRWLTQISEIEDILDEIDELIED